MVRAIDRILGARVEKRRLAGFDQGLSDVTSGRKSGAGNRGSIRGAAAKRSADNRRRQGQNQKGGWALVEGANVA